MFFSRCNVACAKPFAFIAVLLLLSGCVSNQVLYTVDDARAADTPGFSKLRAYLDTERPLPAEWDWNWMPATPAKAKNILVISGGGAGGAFSVGVLAAWTKQQTRPSFDVVTGVSTGALIAPYAFLGPHYDNQLVRLYTSGIAESLVDRRFLPAGIVGESLLKADPLQKLVAQNITPTILAAIAAEHRKGRRLFVLTANLAAQRAVVWNMGAIAASGRADALDLFRQVLVASASIPGVYPAVRIKTEYNGHIVQELHSDGGTVSQFFAFPDAVMASATLRPLPKKSKTNLYILVNMPLMPEFANTADSTLPSLARAYSMVSKSQTRNSIIALYGFSKRAGIGFHMASIDAEFQYSPSDPFDTVYMRSVFSLGYKKMADGNVWKNTPVFPATHTDKPVAKRISTEQASAREKQ